MLSYETTSGCKKHWKLLWKIIIRIHIANNIMTYNANFLIERNPRKNSPPTHKENPQWSRLDDCEGSEKSFLLSPFAVPEIWGFIKHVFCTALPSFHTRTLSSLSTRKQWGKYGGKLDCFSLLLVFTPETLLDRRSLLTRMEEAYPLLDSHIRRLKCAYCCDHKIRPFFMKNLILRSKQINLYCVARSQRTSATECPFSWVLRGNKANWERIKNISNRPFAFL